jgi:hypothetical protein
MEESGHKLIEGGLLGTLRARLNSAFEKRWSGSIDKPVAALFCLPNCRIA